MPSKNRFFDKPVVIKILLMVLLVILSGIPSTASASDEDLQKLIATFGPLDMSDIDKWNQWDAATEKAILNPPPGVDPYKLRMWKGLEMRRAKQELELKEWQEKKRNRQKIDQAWIDQNRPKGLGYDPEELAQCDDVTRQWTWFKAKLGEEMHMTDDQAEVDFITKSLDSSDATAARQLIECRNRYFALHSKKVRDYSSNDVKISAEWVKDNMPPQPVNPKDQEACDVNHQNWERFIEKIRLAPGEWADPLSSASIGMEVRSNRTPKSVLDDLVVKQSESDLQCQKDYAQFVAGGVIKATETDMEKPISTVEEYDFAGLRNWADQNAPKFPDNPVDQAECDQFAEDFDLLIGQIHSYNNHARWVELKTDTPWEKYRSEFARLEQTQASRRAQGLEACHARVPASTMSEGETPGLGGAGAGGAGGGADAGRVDSPTALSGGETEDNDLARTLSDINQEVTGYAGELDRAKMAAQREKAVSGSDDDLSPGGACGYDYKAVMAKVRSPEVKRTFKLSEWNPKDQISLQGGLKAALKINREELEMARVGLAQARSRGDRAYILAMEDTIMIIEPLVAALECQLSNR